MNLSICFLGTGYIVRKHVKILKKLFPFLKLSVASRDAARAKSFQKEFDLYSSFPTYHEAIESDVDIIVVATPPKQHFEWVKKALDCNKNILIEKPVFCSLQEFDVLKSQMENSKQVIMVAENQSFDPFHQKIKNILKNSDLGRPVYLEINRFGVNKLQAWRKLNSEMPLGALHEGGVHYIRRLREIASLYESSSDFALRSLKSFSLMPDPETSFEESMLVMA